jgi:F-box protein 11
LCDNLALSESAARWAIESWAWALGLITDAELTANETESAGKQGRLESAESVSISPVETQTIQAKQNSSPILTSQIKQPTSQQPANVAALNSVFVVSAKGGGNYTTITEALRNVPANSRLLIREGLYQESVVLDKNVEIVGDGALENIIVRSRSQSCVSMQTEKAAVRGLTLQGRGKAYSEKFFAVDVPRGTLFLENCDISSDTLSCAAIRGANADPFIKNCSIHDGADSGIYLLDNARARIEHCEIYRNANVNLAITQGANPAIKSCCIYEGSNGGIVVWGNGATAIIENCEIYDHRLANVGVSQSANPIFRRCKIFGGRDSGVLISQNGYGVFEECEIYGNRKPEVVVTDGSNTTLRRCTVHNGNESGVFVSSKSRMLIESCNIYDNADAGVSIHGASVVAVLRSNIHRNGKVAVRVIENSRASVEDSDLRGNRIAAWETEHGVIVERKNNRE